MKNNDKQPQTKGKARYHVKRDALEIEWLNADAPGANESGSETARWHELPSGLNGLRNRCYEADRKGGVGEWVEMTNAELVIYGVKRI